MRTRQVRHVRWEPAAGELEHFFDDDLVCASIGIHPRAAARAIEPFPMQELKPYDAGYVAGWVVERYQVDLPAGAEAARAQMNDKLLALCAAQIPGRHLPQPERARAVDRPDVQARARAGMAADATTTAAEASSA